MNSDFKNRRRSGTSESASAGLRTGDVTRPANIIPRPDSVAGGEAPLIEIDSSPAKYVRRNFPYFEKPTEIASFSQDREGNFLNDRSMLRRLWLPSIAGLNCDLNEGYSTFDKRDEKIKDNLDDILRCILLNRHLLLDRDRKPPDFVCFRGLLTKVLCTPYATREGWSLAACKLGSTVYLCECNKQSASFPNEDLMTYWGYKFEQYVTVKKGALQPEIDKSVTNKEAFYSVVSTRLGKHSLLYGGEVDCCVGGSRSPSDAAGVGDAAESDAATSSYVELKTSRDFEHAGQERNFKKFKVLKWWAQSYLLGVPEVVCGFRDDAGVVHRVGRYKTLQLPRMVRGERDMWDPAVCFNFLDDFLSLVKDCVVHDELMYVFEYCAGSSAVQGRAYPSDDERYSFLPDWYRNCVFSDTKSSAVQGRVYPSDDKHYTFLPDWYRN